MLRVFDIFLDRLSVGSPQWHKVQEKLNQKSAIGLDMKLRNRFYEKTLPDCETALYVHPGVYFSYPQNIKLGYNVFINRGVYLTAPAQITIGDNALIGPFCMLNSGSHLYSNPKMIIRNQGHKIAPITLEDDVWLGAHVCVMPGVTIHKGAVVAANAVVTKDVPPFTVVAGVPAREINRRK